MSSMTKIFGAVALVGALAAGATTMAPAPAQAGDAGKFIAGAIIGGAAGAMINEHHHQTHRRRHHHHARRGGGNRHVRWCYNHYRSYDARSDTYVTYSGRVRRCRSPFSG